MHVGVKQDAIQQSGQARWVSRQDHTHHININIHIYTYMHICHIYIYIYMYIYIHAYVGGKQNAVRQSGQARWVSRQDHSHHE